MIFISPANTTANTSPRHILGASIIATQCGTGHSFERPLGPFAVLYEVREPLKPKSNLHNGWARRKAKLAADAARNPDTVAQKTAKVLRVNKESNVGFSTVGAGIRAASIRKTGVC